MNELIKKNNQSNYRSKHLTDELVQLYQWCNNQQPNYNKKENKNIKA